LIFLLPSFCIAQNSCVYNKPKKFDEYKIDLNTEYAGLFLNGMTLRKKQFQIEGNSYLGALINSYNRRVYAGFLQLRYAIISSTEVQFGGLLQNPPAINVDTQYNQQINIGIKQKLFKFEGRITQWNLAYNAKYIFQRSWMEGNQIRNGIMFSADNSWIIKRVTHIDLSVGTQYFSAKNLFQPLISGKILVKDEPSKIGIFMGFCGDNYTESLLTLGLQFTDNCNFVFLLAVGFLDHALTPNISYTHIFTNQK